jgi:shikimate kinase
MNVVLTGFMGTGKSAVGRRVAERLRAPFHDIDAAIAKKVGQSISAFFAEKGEAAFRAEETQVIETLSALDGCVISTGGGALLVPRNRQLLQRNGLLVCLSAKVGTLLERLKEDVSRPLLSGENRMQRIEDLMKQRESLYAECPVQIVTDGKTIEQVAEEIFQRVAADWKPV